MQSVSQTYSALIAGDHTKQVRIIIGEDSDDMILSENSLYSMETEASLFASRTLSFGGCVSKTITVKLDPGSMIVPRMAKLRPQVRLRHGSTVSEWLTKGVYYVDTREYDETTGILTLTGYDAMLMAEETYIREGDVGQWPRTMPQVVSDIVSRLGVSLDGRTSLTAYTVQLPVGYTMREVLGYIAAAHAGNWVMTDEGKLRLITADETVDCAVLDDSVMTLKTDDAFDEITKVDLSVTDDTYVEAGDDTGRKISLFCPWGTEQMAIDILGRFDGFVYRPYTADGAVLDPAYEIGDNAAVGSFTGMIVTQDLTFNSLCLSNISAPAEDEIDHEYPYQSSFRRMVERKIRSTEATLKVETDAIIARVEGLADNSISGVSVQYALGDSSSSAPTSGWSATPPAWVSGKYIWQKTVTTYTDNATSETYTAESQPFCVPNDGTGISSIVSEYYLSDSYVEQTGGSWESTVPAWQEGKYIWTRTHVYYTGGTDTYTAPVLNLSSDDLGKKYAELKVTVDGIDLTGMVTFNSLKTQWDTSTTYINGGNIRTDNLKVKQVWNYDGTKLAMNTGNSDSDLYIGGVYGQGGWDYDHIYIYANTDISFSNHLNNLPLIISPNDAAVRPNTANTWSLGTPLKPFNTSYAACYYADYNNAVYGKFGYDLNALYCSPMNMGTSYLGDSSYYWQYAYIGSLSAKIGSSSMSTIGFFGSTGSQKLTIYNSTSPLRPIGNNPAQDLVTTMVTVNWLTYVLGSYGLFFESYS